MNRPTAPGVLSYRLIWHISRHGSWGSVVRVWDRGDDRILGKVGMIHVPLTRGMADEISELEVVALLCQATAETLWPTGPAKPAPAPPEGDTGGEPWTQQTLNLDLRS